MTEVSRMLVVNVFWGLKVVFLTLFFGQCFLVLDPEAAFVSCSIGTAGKIKALTLSISRSQRKERPGGEDTAHL